MRHYERTIMKVKFWEKVPSIYEEPIKKVLIEMQENGVETEEYSTAVRHLETLTKLKTEEGRKRVSADTMAIVVGNLLGILVIVAYEQKHVMTTKANWGTLKPK
jgi:hypothetical protein